MVGAVHRGAHSPSCPDCLSTGCDLKLSLDHLRAFSYCRIYNSLYPLFLLVTVLGVKSLQQPHDQLSQYQIANFVLLEHGLHWNFSGVWTSDLLSVNRISVHLYSIALT